MFKCSIVQKIKLTIENLPIFIACTDKIGIVSALYQILIELFYKFKWYKLLIFKTAKASFLKFSKKILCFLIESK